MEFANKYLQWNIWIKHEDRKLLSPQKELLSFCINVVVKHSALSWKFYSLELIDPPLGEFYTVVNGLYKQQHTVKQGHRDSPDGYMIVLFPI
jgi:hypothetical protein